MPIRRYVQRVPTSLTIAVGLLLVAYQQWVGPLPTGVQVVFCVGLLLVAGIPHGALDHFIEQEWSDRRERPFSMLRFVAKYLLMVAVYGVGWLLFPVLSLVLFLLISAWHFGETDIENAPAEAYWSLTRFVAGGFVLAFILLTHSAETTPILGRIVQNDTLTMRFWHGTVSQAGTMLRGWATLTVVLAMLASGQQSIRVDGWRLVRLGTVISLTYLLPLLPAFMLYFGGWHALCSFNTIRAYLRQPAGGVRSVWNLWRQSMPLTVVSFGFLGICAGVWYAFMPTFDPMPVLFILLSTITLPHIQVMYRLNRHIN